MSLHFQCWRQLPNICIVRSTSSSCQTSWQDPQLQQEEISIHSWTTLRSQLHLLFSPMLYSQCSVPRKTTWASQPQACHTLSSVAVLCYSHVPTTFYSSENDTSALTEWNNTENALINANELVCKYLQRLVLWCSVQCHLSCNLSLEYIALLIN